MKYSLARMTRRVKNPRRSTITLRPIAAPGTLATDLYQAAYSPVVKAWEAAIDPIMAEYERSLAALTSDSAADIGSVIERHEGDLFRLILTLRLRLEQWALRVEKWHRTKWRGAVLSATGVDVNTMIGAGDMRETLGAAVERNVGLVRSVSEQARTRIGDAVFRGLSQRKPAREVAAEIREAVAMSRRRALNIASDQNSKLAAQLNTERAREAGLEFYEWLSSHKIHYRPEHRARDGKRYEYGEPSGDEPGMAINCGCVARACLTLGGEF